MENVLLLGASGLVVVFGVSARKALQKSWKKVAGNDPPLDPSNTETPWTQALLWAGLSGMVVGVARLAGRRLSAEGVARITSTKSRKVDVS